MTNEQLDNLAGDCRLAFGHQAGAYNDGVDAMLAAVKAAQAQSNELQLVQNLLNEYGLQALDVVKTFKEAQAAVEPDDCANTPWDEGPFTIAEQAAVEPVNAWQIFGLDGEPMFIQQDAASAKRYEEAGHVVKRLSYYTTPPDHTAAMRAALDALVRLSHAYNWKPFVTEDENDPWKPVEQYGLDAIAQLRAFLPGEQG